MILANGASTSLVPCALTRGSWVHLAVVANGPTAEVYVNGQPVGATTNGIVDRSLKIELGCVLSTHFA